MPTAEAAARALCTRCLGRGCCECARSESPPRGEQGSFSRLSCCLLCALLAACRAERHPPVELRLGPDQHRIEPRVALAEYLELPGSRNELKITLASYEASCDRFIPPGPGDKAVTVVVVVPPSDTLGPGVYPWSGASANDTGQLPVRPIAVPKAFIGHEGHVFKPGGAVQLTRVLLEPNGMVEGVLAFDFAGDGSSPATSLKGPFRARFCRLELAPRSAEHDDGGPEAGSTAGRARGPR